MLGYQSADQNGGSARGYHGAVVSLAARRARFPSPRGRNDRYSGKLFRWLPVGLPALSFKIGTWL
jgi:hypothetical protein